MPDKKIEGAKEVEKVEEKADLTVKADSIVTEEELLKAIDLLEEFTKASEETEEEEEDDDKKDEEEDEEKSIQSMEDSETLEKAIDVSPFLEALVNETSLALEAVGSKLNSFQKSMSEFDGKYVESLRSLAEIVKGLHSEMKEFFKATGERLAVIEQTPIGGPRSIRKAVEIKKSFVAGNESGETDFSQLSKRQIADALSKAWQDGKVKDTVVMAFEGEHTNQLTPEIQEIVKAYIK